MEVIDYEDDGSKPSSQIRVSTPTGLILKLFIFHQTERALLVSQYSQPTRSQKVWVPKSSIKIHARSNHQKRLRIDAEIDYDFAIKKRLTT